MYAINGIPLDENLDGWRLLRSGTAVHGGITKSVSKVATPGRPGYRPVPSVASEQTVVLRVRTPLDRMEELLSLANAAAVLTKVTDPTREAAVELLSAIPSSTFPMDALQDVTITLSAYEGAWRDVNLTTVGPLDVTTPTQTFTMFDGLSAPVYDADIFIGGVFDEFRLEDSGGSWLQTSQPWPGSSTTGLLWVGATQQAFVADESNPWVPSADASQYVDASGNGNFRLTPAHVSGAPSDREVSLELTTLEQTDTTFMIRAKRAYWMG